MKPATSACRAYLLSIDFEEQVDSDADMLRQDRDLFLPAGYDLTDMFLTSPNKVQRDLSAKTIRKGNTYYRNKGRLPLELEDQVIFNGEH